MGGLTPRCLAFLDVFGNIPAIWIHRQAGGRMLVVEQRDCPSGATLLRTATVSQAPKQPVSPRVCRPQKRTVEDNWNGGIRTHCITLTAWGPAPLLDDSGGWISSSYRGDCSKPLPEPKPCAVSTKGRRELQQGKTRTSGGKKEPKIEWNCTFGLFFPFFFF